MTILQISIACFVLAIATVGLLYVIMSVADEEPKVWRNGLFTCMAALCAAVILIFIPSYAMYAPLVGLLGVFLMIVAVCIVRWNAANGNEMERTQRRGYAVRATVFVMAGGLLATPFFTLFDNQQEVKTMQYGIVGYLVRLEKKIDTLNAMLERDHKERVAQAVLAQAERTKIYSSLKGVEVKVNNSLQNDRDVKKALGKTNRKASPALIIVAPTPRSIPQSSFPLSTDKVKTPDPHKAKRGRRLGMQAEQEAPDWILDSLMLPPNYLTKRP